MTGILGVAIACGIFLIALGVAYLLGHKFGFDDGREYQRCEESEKRLRERAEQARRRRTARTDPWVFTVPDGRHHAPPRPRPALEHRRNTRDGQFEVIPGTPAPVPTAATITPVVWPVFTSMTDAQFISWLAAQ